MHSPAPGSEEVPQTSRPQIGKCLRALQHHQVVLPQPAGCHSKHMGLLERFGVLDGRGCGVQNAKRSKQALNPAMQALNEKAKKQNEQYIGAICS